MRLRKSASVARASTLFANSSLSSSESAIISAAPRLNVRARWWFGGLRPHRETARAKQATQRRNLSERRGACARNRAVGRTQGFGHAVLVRHHGPARSLFIGQSELCARRLVFLRPRDMHHIQSVNRKQLLFERRDSGIDVARAQAAAENEQHRGILRNAQHFPALFARSGKHRRTHRVAR